MEYFLGVDAGGSKTHAMILDLHGHVQGFGSSGCGNHQVNGLNSAVAEIKKAVDTAAQQTNISFSDIQVGAFCLAGADLQTDYELLIPAMESLRVARKVLVKNDTMAALRASITRPWGVAVICGSGFNAAARSIDGIEIVFPALGYISGDWGGGSQLSHEMIRLVMRAWDGRGEKTSLTQAVLDNLDVRDEETLLEQLYTEKISEQRLLQLVPLLFTAAESDDLVSQKLVIQMGEEVAVAANALIKRLSMQSLDVEVGLAGGVFKNKGCLLIDTVIHHIHQVAAKAIVRKTRYEPVVGAALSALEGGGVTVSQLVYQQLDETLPAQLRYEDAASRSSPVKTGSEHKM